ncbi:hypothetical protein J7E63_27120 [Bacillus sp. ISL-75]|uniref:hypothetical protein n=1 Tax=Bacillus sp. ISL-75 TaxID=2819137 RepID=UPI001BE60837|nr:hypothetical protein [Bacillus sp. ISL-75]MBT2730502.1 hypothetical protein [Bacillus sp. ISL-75]
MYRKSIDNKLFWLIFMGIASAILSSIFSGIIITLSLKSLRTASKNQSKGEVVNLNNKARRG